jgi:hypothetical protein
MNRKFLKQKKRDNHRKAIKQMGGFSSVSYNQMRQSRLIKELNRYLQATKKLQKAKKEGK